MTAIPNPLPPVLDATCGSRSIWFDKAHPFALYVDRRREHHECDFGDKSFGHRSLDIEPDVLADFTALPFPDESFWHVVWDPPHLLDAAETQWYFKAYGTLRSADWREVIGGGWRECWRVLKPGGTLVFKWADVSISTPEVLSAIPSAPLYGHRSGKKSGTHWMIFFKPPKEP